MDQIWNSILDFASKFVIPDWGALIALIPIAILALSVLFVAWLLWRLTLLGPKRRGKGRVRPVPPPGVHAPTPSFAPIFGAVGAFLVLFGLVFGPVILALGIGALILTLLYWGAESMRDYDHAAGATTLPAVIPHEPPPGVHMPGPSFRPIVAAIAVAVMFYGLVFGGWLLAMGLIMLVVSLVGWLRDARAEYALAERADASGHLDSLPAPRVPTGTFALFGALFVLGIILNSGIIPSGAASGATGGSPAPGRSAAPGGSPATGGSAAPGGSPATGGSAAPGGSPAASLPAADVTVTAEGVAYDTATLSSKADQPFSIAFVNKDAGIPHNMEVADASGAILWEGETITGVANTVYTVPPLKAGTYKFQCKWHPNMVGELTAK
jgi:plastocyanin